MSGLPDGASIHPGPSIKTHRAAKKERASDPREENITTEKLTGDVGTRRQLSPGKPGDAVIDLDVPATFTKVSPSAHQAAVPKGNVAKGALETGSAAGVPEHLPVAASPSVPGLRDGSARLGHPISPVAHGQQGRVKLGAPGLPGPPGLPVSGGREGCGRGGTGGGPSSPPERLVGAGC